MCPALRLLQRFIRRKRWRKMIGAFTGGASLPLIHGPCGMVAWPINVPTRSGAERGELRLDGMEGPSGRQYRFKAFGFLGVDSPLRRATIFLIEWSWFDRLSLFVVSLNCAIIAAQGPPGRNAVFTQPTMAQVQPRQASQPASAPGRPSH